MEDYSEIRQIEQVDWVYWKLPLIDLFQAAYERDISSEYLDWRYVLNGEKVFFSVFGDANNLLASYSVAPVQLMQNTNEFKTAISMTTMTHPLSRGKGIFPKLAGDLYQRIANDGISMVWGFMNDSSHRIFVRELGWHDIYEIPTMSLSLPTKIGFMRSDESQVSRDDEFKLQYRSTISDEFIRTERTSSFLRWRYADHPRNVYRNYVVESGGEACSYVVIKEYLDGIDLVDIQVSCENHAMDLIGFIIQESMENKKMRISCWISVHHFVHGVLERLGFKNTGPVTYFGGRALLVDEAPKGWQCFSNWYIQMGDSDIF